MSYLLGTAKQLVRFSYVNVFEPRAMSEGDEKKYSVSVLIPKKYTALVVAVEDAIEDAIEASIAQRGKKWEKVVSSKRFKYPLRDGDEDRPDDEAYKGMMYLTASCKASQRAPQVVDASREPLTDSEDFDSGDYGRVSVNFYAFDVAGNVGIACGLNNIQKAKDGERLSGAAKAEIEFDDDEFEAYIFTGDDF